MLVRSDHLRQHRRVQPLRRPYIAGGPGTLAASNDSTLGFYTVEENETLGWMGGYLLLNVNGRPLEFHCSLPLRPTRTQQVLYGPSLRPFLIGDLIGRTVIQRAKLNPSLILTDQADALGLSTSLNTPVACTEVFSGASDEDMIEIDDRSLVAASDTREMSIEVLRMLPASFDLSEPFERIREAFAEARGSSKTAA